MSVFNSYLQTHKMAFLLVLWGQKCFFWWKRSEENCQSGSSCRVTVEDYTGVNFCQPRRECEPTVDTGSLKPDVWRLNMSEFANPHHKWIKHHALMHRQVSFLHIHADHMHVFMLTIYPYYNGYKHHVASCRWQWHHCTLVASPITRIGQHWDALQWDICSMNVQQTHPWYKHKSLCGENDCLYHLS